MKVAKDKKLSYYKKKAWKLFSEFIRRRFADREGYVTCVTCGVRIPWENSQAGHFIDGRSNSVLFSEIGTQVQCYRCNCCLSGNKIPYYQYMEKNYGRNIIDILIKEKSHIIKFTKEDYKEMAERYERKLKEL